MDQLVFSLVDLRGMEDRYGSTVTSTVTSDNNGDSFSAPRQTFSIAEDNNGRHHSDTTPLRGGRDGRGGGCCGGVGRCFGGGNGGFDDHGLRVIVLSMFVFAAAVTVALVFQVASGVAPTEHVSDEAVSDHPECSAAAEAAMAGGGNAVDAAVAAAFCLAAVAPHIAGIGGGGIMLIHKHRENKTTVIDFRETAPAIVANDKYVKNPKLASTGPTSIGVPGFVAGLALAHAKHGSGHVGIDCCSWSQLVRPAIRVGRSLMVTESLLNASDTKISPEELIKPYAKNLEDMIRPNGEGLSLETSLYDLMPYIWLMQTLDVIARDGPDAFYKGTVGKVLVEETEGQITEEDLESYEAVEREAVQTRLGKFTVLSSPAPSSGPQLLSILNAMHVYRKRYGITPVDADYLRNISQVLSRTQSFFLGLGDPFGDDRVEDRTQWMLDKANAYRFLNPASEGEPAFASSYATPEPAATTAATMDRNDVYVSVVTSLNTWFGSRVMTSNGILLNNALSNFDASSDSDGANALPAAAGRRPLALPVAALAFDAEQICGERILVSGASPDVLGQVLTDAVVFGQDLSTAVNRDRLHLDPSDAAVGTEDAYDGAHPLDPAALDAAFDGQTKPLRLPYSTVAGLDKRGDTVLAVPDARSGNVKL